MNYRYLGNRDYEITLIIYRDCNGNGAPFDDPASIGIFDDRSNLIQNFYVSIVYQGKVPNIINSPCVDSPTDVCYEIAKYVFNVHLETESGASTIVYQRCCRNHSIINIDNVDGTGATYLAVITDPLIEPVNSNPVFNNWPPTFICKDAPFKFDHSATDPDGDSLVYEISYPFAGADIVFPAPDPPSAPPYTPVYFLPPYSFDDPFGGVPLQIDPATGILKATPNSIGQFVYGISVKEYRNGIYLGETRRDFQINIVSCPAFTVASVFSPTIACGSLSANFINNSYNAATYKWDFGDPFSLVDTSSKRNPVFEYSNTGDYITTLIAYSPFNSLCNDTAFGIVHVYPPFHSDFIFSNDHCSNQFSFMNQSFGLNGAANFWSWKFGDNSRSFIPNPVHVFNKPGEYNITLSASADSGCQDTMVKKIFVLQNPESKFSFLFDTCSFSIKTKNLSSFAELYQWDYGDLYFENNIEGIHKFKNPGEFDIQLIVASDSFCLDTSNLHISIPPLPVADYTYEVLICDSVVKFTNLSQNAKEFIWDFGDKGKSNSYSPIHIYSLSGSLPVSLTAISASKCPSVSEKSIYFISKKKSDYYNIIDSCNGLVQFNSLAYNATNYYWEFGDGSISEELNPVHKYNIDGSFDVSLTVNHETICSDKVMKTVYYEEPLGERVFVPNSFTPNGDGKNDFFEISAYRPCEIYKLTIFDRWGQKVFENDDASNIHWDGSFKGEKLAEDIYVYILESIDSRKKGVISILR